MILKYLEPCNFIVFEGFEMTGKTHLLNQVKNAFDNAISYRPDWEGVFSDEVVSRGNRYIPGLVAADFFKKLDLTDKRLLIDRWVGVSYVYQKMYNQTQDCSDFSEVIKSAKEITSGMKMIFVHKYHSSKEEARRMYNISVADNDHSDVYDKFESFEDYWKKYLDFEELYEQFYRESGFPVIMISSYYNKIGDVIL